MAATGRVWSGWERALWGLVALGAAAGLWAGIIRWRSEAANRTVTIAVDFNSAAELAQRVRRPVDDVLAALRTAGAGALAFEPYTLLQAGEYGVVTVGGRDVRALTALGGTLPEPWRTLLNESVHPDWTYVAWRAGQAPAWVADDLAGALEPVAVDRTEVASREGAWTGLALPFPLEQANLIGLGFPRDRAGRAADAGFGIVARFANDPGIDRWFDAAVPLQPIAVIFSGEEALGYPDRLDAAARRLGEAELPFGLIEFTPQKGTGYLARLTRWRALRVHSIPSRELQTLSLGAALDRWERAVQDRDIRLLYVHLYQEGAPPGESSALLNRNTAYLGGLKARLAASGVAIGPARLFAPFQTPPWLLAVLAAGAAAAAALLFRLFFPLSAGGQALLGVMACAAAPLFLAAYLKGYGTLAREGAALLAATAFPALAVVGEMARRGLSGAGWRAPDRAPGATEGPKGNPEGIVTTARRFARVSGLSLLGAVFVVGLLGDIRFLLKVDQFVGVKAMHVIPLLLAGACAVAWWGALQPAGDGGPGRGPARGLLPAVVGGAGRLFRQPLTLGHAAAAGLLGLAALVYVARTGNQGLAPPAVELALRQGLENLLVVRPRTKEFLIGHPLLWLALRWSAPAAGHAGSAVAARLLPWAPWLFVAGAIGQLSMVNTFTHIHSPLAISLVRTAYGLVLGLLCGLGADWIVRRAVGRLNR